MHLSLRALGAHTNYPHDTKVTPNHHTDNLTDTRPSVLFLGDFAHEGIAAKIENLGFHAIRKSLRSGPRNWERVIDLARALNDAERLVAVFGYRPTPTLLYLCSDELDEYWPPLAAELERTRTLLFVYEENLQGIIEAIPWEYESLEEEQEYRRHFPEGFEFPPSMRKPTREEWFEENAGIVARAEELLAELSSGTIELVPFRKRSDVTIRILETLDDIDLGVLLRVYVPHGRYQAEQFEEFLNLFQRYFREVEQREFAIDAHRTQHGTTYVFKARTGAVRVDQLREAMQRFDGFMAIAQSDPSRAEELLRQAGLQPSDAQVLVAKYSREYQRLLLDARHELETRKLLLGQQLESEILEAEYVRAVPAVEESKPSSLFSIVGNSGPVTINFPASQFNVGSSSGVIADQIVAGDITYTSQDKEILSLIDRVAGDVEALALKSELERLKDETTPPEQRKTGVQKLKSFLYRAGRHLGGKATDIGIKVLVAYLESLISHGSG
jgi:hypothetical protein